MQIVGYVLACRSYPFVCTLHHHIIIIVQTYLKSLIYFVECMSKIKHILLVSHHTICGAVCFQFNHFLCDNWDNMYTLSYYHRQIGSMNYYPLFRVRSWNNGMHCISFYILRIRWVMIWPIYILGITIKQTQFWRWWKQFIPTILPWDLAFAHLSPLLDPLMWSAQPHPGW